MFSLTLSIYTHNFILLLRFFNSVSSLTCEALQASSASFDSSLHDVSHPHRGAMVCAQNLRTLLEGSRQAEEASSKRERQDVDAIKQIAQYQGPAREVIEVQCEDYLYHS